jgi:hypothetical protein
MQAGGTQLCNPGCVGIASPWPQSRGQKEIDSFCRIQSAEEGEHHIRAIDVCHFWQMYSSPSNWWKVPFIQYNLGDNRYCLGSFFRRTLVYFTISVSNTQTSAIVPTTMEYNRSFSVTPTRERGTIDIKEKILPCSVIILYKWLPIVRILVNSCCQKNRFLNSRTPNTERSGCQLPNISPDIRITIRSIE